TSLGVPSNFDNGDTALLQQLDFMIHDLHWFFNELKLVINMYFIQQELPTARRINTSLNWIRETCYEPCLIVEEVRVCK
ncbi:hypothetical protein Tco_0416715, partial [Tanacetum coccineum]